MKVVKTIYQGSILRENPIKFGTDGWRGIIADDFTFDNVRTCARAVADYLNEAKLADKGLVIGYDTRFASEDFATTAAEVVAAAGIKVHLCQEATPTPVISYSTVNLNAGGAIVITASHNPAAWNGFKYKSENGASASDEITSLIEDKVSRLYGKDSPVRIPLEEALKTGLIGYTNPLPSYIDHLSKLINLDEIRNSGLRVIVDPMYGAGSGYLKNLLDGGSTEIIEINNERNPLFPGIQPEPIAANLGKLMATITEQKASIGIATDGDADRLGIVDENGHFISTVQVLALLTYYLLEVRGERGLIVKTINTSVMMNRLAEIYGVDIIEEPIGFKHIAPHLEKNALIGGEESGGYGFRGHLPERDGILAALYFLDLMVKTGKTPSQLLDHLFSLAGTHYYDRIDVHFPLNERDNIFNRVKSNPPEKINEIKVDQLNTMDGYKYTLTDDSWLLIRFSGTEPLLRIYTESSTPQKVEELLRAGKKLVGI
ncbi:MAG: phosphoglucomutase/phosphomannomutase family protein [Dehalococcoidales bacterium]|nr:phosphoglucomutase/phosphomannomutase family protein [Dehalococcoidales bacterium]